MRHKIKGVVIRESQKGETSKLLTVLTDSMGVIIINAKGVRKLSSPYLKCAQLFAFSDMLIYEKNGYYTLTEAALITDFYSISKDMNNYALACYLCDAASTFAVKGEESNNLLRLVLNSLYAIENNIAPRAIIKSAFELRLCSECGFEPSVNFCSECDDELDDKVFYFDVANADSYCDSCVLKTPFVFPVSISNQKAIFHIIECELSRLFSFRVHNQDLEILTNITEKYLLYRAERGFKTLSFYKHCEELP